MKYALFLTDSRENDRRRTPSTIPSSIKEMQTLLFQQGAPLSPLHYHPPKFFIFSTNLILVYVGVVKTGRNKTSSRVKSFYPDKDGFNGSPGRPPLHAWPLQPEVTAAYIPFSPQESFLVRRPTPPRPQRTHYDPSF